jgi:hypothetical protein
MRVDNERLGSRRTTVDLFLKVQQRCKIDDTQIIGHTVPCTSVPIRWFVPRGQKCAPSALSGAAPLYLSARGAGGSGLTGFLKSNIL